MLTFLSFPFTTNYLDFPPKTLNTVYTLAHNTMHLLETPRGSIPQVRLLSIDYFDSKFKAPVTYVGVLSYCERFFCQTGRSKASNRLSAFLIYFFDLSHIISIVSECAARSWKKMSTNSRFNQPLLPRSISLVAMLLCFFLQLESNCRINLFSALTGINWYTNQNIPLFIFFYFSFRNISEG